MEPFRIAADLVPFDRVRDQHLVGVFVNRERPEPPTGGSGSSVMTCRCSPVSTRWRTARLRLPKRNRQSPGSTKRPWANRARLTRRWRSSFTSRARRSASTSHCSSGCRPIFGPPLNRSAIQRACEASRCANSFESRDYHQTVPNAPRSGPFLCLKMKRRRPAQLAGGIAAELISGLLYRCSIAVGERP
jgi:hypothetical protein